MDVFDYDLAKPFSFGERYDLVAQHFRKSIRIIYIDDVFLVCEESRHFRDKIERGDVYIVGQCRSSEWGSKVERYLGSFALKVELHDLDQADLVGLRDGLLIWGVAPEFRGQAPDQRLRTLQKAKRQLLVAMKEITRHKRFSEIIEDEFESLTSQEARLIFTIIALATMGRAGLTAGELATVAREAGHGDPLDRSFQSLQEMIAKDAGGRLVGRHEVYVRHIIENIIPSQMLKDCFVALLRYFTQFGEPVITKLDKRRANLFKFLLNKDQLFEIFSRKNDVVMAERVYSSVEHEYQRDGHYWLQRGLLYRRPRATKMWRPTTSDAPSRPTRRTNMRSMQLHNRGLYSQLPRLDWIVVQPDLWRAVAELERQIQVLE